MTTIAERPPPPRAPRLPPTYRFRGIPESNHRPPVLPDHSGTLINYQAFSEMKPLADGLWKDLLTLASDSRNTVVVMTGRERGLVSQVRNRTSRFDSAASIALLGGIF